MAHVVIVGAGPAGAALAFLLARRGIQVTLLERQTDFAREFRGEGLQPGGIEALAQMGLQAQVDRLPQSRLSTVDIYYRDRPPLAMTPTVMSGAAEGPRLVSQPALLEMLVAEAGRYPSFRFERGATVRELIQDHGRVVGVRAEAPGGPLELSADLVIGTDGRGSIVRRLAGLQAEKLPQAFDVVWCKLPMPRWYVSGCARSYLGAGYMVGVFPSYDGRIQLGWVIRKGAFGELRRQGIDQWLEALSRQVSPDLARHLEEHRAEVTHPFLLNVICERLLEWTRPGLLLLGDAAHPMSPVGGQGINIALRDVLVAANHLCPVLSADGPVEAIDAAARAVQVERLPEVVRIQAIQHQQARLLLGDSPWTGLMFRLLPLFLRFAALRRLGNTRSRVFARGTTRIQLLE